MDLDENMHIGITVEQINIDREQFEREPNVEALPVLPTKNVVLFPNVTISVNLKRDISVKAVQYASDKKIPIGVICQKDMENETPRISHLYKYGVVADIIKIFDLPDGDRAVLLRGREPFRVLGVGKRGSLPSGILSAKVAIYTEEFPEMKDKQFDALYKKIKQLLKKILPAYSDGLMHVLNNLDDDDDPITLINHVATNLPFTNEEKIKMLAMRDTKMRAMELLRLLYLKEQEIDLSMGIMNQVKAEMSEDQRRTFLQRQMDVISDQLYGDVDDSNELYTKSLTVNLPAEVREIFDKNLNKLRRINPQNPDYSVLFSYLETLLDLPWDNATEVNTDFKKAKETLDRDHCGLDKVKERILEQLAVMMNNPEGRSPILCLVGPPGVGKTSLGRSIAEALGRNYQRVSLGGLHDEAEIRGHRRTYIGAMPGRVIDALKRAKSSNPVIVLDEVDKIGTDYKGDPSSALLEVLDPEQNSHFHDNYVDVDFDLSNVFFIATANNLASVPAPLIDRMEIITLSGYSPEEKLEIAREHLIPRTQSELCVAKDAFAISDEALNAVIDNYTSESGVRQLEKAIAKMNRKYLMNKLSGIEFPATVETSDLTSILGLAPHLREKYEGNEFAGVVTGLAWTEVGGEILLAEASLSKGKGEITITGNLGQVMKESASIALQWVKAHAQQLEIDPTLFEKYNLHLHFPEGAIPKDGPSAGITIATAIVSAFKQKRVRGNIAMTGEITLRGKVLPVGGIKEKILAAKRAGITDILLSQENRRDIEDIDSKYLEGLNFHYVNSVLDVMRFAITDEDVIDKITL